MKGGRGFIFMTDAVFALLLAVITLALVNQTFDIGQSDVWRDDSLHKTAEDVLIVLDKNGTIENVAGMSEINGEAFLSSAVDALLTSTLAANVTFTTYEDDDDNGVFNIETIYSVKVPPTWAGNRSAYAKRLYANFDDNNPDNNVFGIAEIWLWTVVE